tara:strand:+ start:16118 stop:16771 length:654 start_codon:yes stop_codon:yes gene_type:complete
LKKIVFNKNTFFLVEQGILYWPKNFVLVVSDLHLEKSSYFAKFGQFLPPYDSIETLNLLDEILKQHKVKTVILLGDVFHDNDGYDRLDRRAKLIFNKINNKYNLLFVVGNHDQDINIPNIKTYEDITIDGINFSHKPSNLNSHQVFGHFHPKILLKLNGKRIFKKCFIVSSTKICMPAFGVFTGGLNVESDIFKKIFKQNKEYFLIDNSHIYQINLN